MAEHASRTQSNRMETAQMTGNADKSFLLEGASLQSIQLANDDGDDLAAPSTEGSSPR